LLHVAAQVDHLEAIVWCLGLGGDPSCKDGKGKKPLDLVTNESCKQILKHSKPSVPRMYISTFSSPPLLKETLQKVFIIDIVDQLQGWISRTIFCIGKRNDSVFSLCRGLS
jgi:hypothetical protein